MLKVPSIKKAQALMTSKPPEGRSQDDARALHLEDEASHQSIHPIQKTESDPSFGFNDDEPSNANINQIKSLENEK